MGGFGTGGGAETGIPNGFREPVWCVFSTTCGCSGTVASGTDADRGGAFWAAAFVGACAKGDANCAEENDDGKGLDAGACATPVGWLAMPKLGNGFAVGCG